MTDMRDLEDDETWIRRLTGDERERVDRIGDKLNKARLLMGERDRQNEIINQYWERK